RSARPAGRASRRHTALRAVRRRVRLRRGLRRVMKHRIGGYKLKRNISSRRALLRNLVTSVIEHERIVTTVPEAKAAKQLVEKMITLAKDDTLHARRQAAGLLQ